MSRLNVRTAIATAKNFVLEVLQEEGPENVGLEEVEFDEDAENWLITIGFSRPWNSIGGILGGLSSTPPHRDYRVVTVSDRSGAPIKMKRREMLGADA